MDNVVVWYMLHSNILMHCTIAYIMYSHLLQSCGGPSASGKAKPGVHCRLNARDIPFILGTVRKLFVQSNTYIDKCTCIDSYVLRISIVTHVHMDTIYECA